MMRPLAPHPRAVPRPIRAAAIALLSLTLLACVPPPRTPLAHPRTRAPQLGPWRPTHETQGAALGPWPATHWWRAFHDRRLNHLIRMGLRANAGLKAARAHLRAAHAAYRLAQARTGLSISFAGRALRERASATGLVPPPFAGHTINYASLGLHARADLSVWDRQHAEVAAALGAARAARAQAALIRLVVSTEIADDDFALAALADRVQAAEAIVRVRRHIRGLLAARYHAGIASAISYNDNEAIVALARTERDEAQVALAKTRLALATLLGRGPRFAHTLTPPALGTLPSQGFPAHVGLDLIARRPDIQVRYWQVEEAVAGRRAARAGYYPNISLSAQAGFASIKLADLVDPANLVTLFGPALNLPIFTSGARRARLSVSRARFDSAVDDYNAAIIRAANHVAYALFVLRIARHRANVARAAARSAHRALVLVAARAQAGVADALTLRKARLTALLQAERAQVTRARVLMAQVAVIKSLGGGYRAPDARSLSAAPL